MKKRLTAFFLAFALVFALLPAAVLTASAEVYTGTCGGEGDGSNLTWTLDKETGVLEISGTGEMENYYYDKSCPWGTYVRTVSISSGVTSIGDRAFFDCDLTSITIPDSVTSIGSEAFVTCTSLTSITIPNGVKSIGEYAFGQCYELTSVTIGSGLTRIYDRAFERCIRLTSITIPDSVKSIGAFAFKGCYKLASVTIPDSVTSIGNSAFINCSGLTSILIGSGVTNIGYAAFDNTGYCKDVSNWTDGILYIGKYLIKAKSAIENAEIKAGTKLIADRAFSGCAALKEINFPAGLTCIGESAFQGCGSLTEVQLPETLAFIDTCAFMDCDALTDVTILNGNCQIEYNRKTLGDRSHTVIHGYLNSTAHYYARAYAYSFEVVTRETPCAGAHDWGEWVENTAPTCVSAGDEVRTCMRCGKVETREIEALGHNFVDGVCTVCGAKAPGDQPIAGMIPGDLNGDGDIDAVDSIRMARYLVGLVDLTDEQQEAADVNGDGDVTATDAIRLARYLVGLVETLRPEPVRAATRATAGAEISVGTAKGKPGETVTVPVTISGNPGFAGFTLTISAADGLTLKDVKKGSLLSSASGMFTANAEKGSASWVGAFDVKGDGELFLLTFAIDAGASGGDRAISIALKNGKATNFANADESAVAVSFKDGKVTVSGGTTPVTPDTPGKFNDVPKSAWYYEAVNYAVSKGLMNGVGSGSFAPNDPMTRAMLVTVLWRYEGEKKQGKNTFTDVPSGQWYTDAVVWAAAKGIVGGVGNNKFDPNGNITREQMAAILFRYAQSKGYNTSKRGSLSGFPDAGRVSSWAKDPIAWAVAAEIIGGSDGKLLPQGNATRAQVSTILMRFIEKFA